jgi:hypothetical protein
MECFHRVTQGEHLSEIGSKYGFPDYRVIWNHPQNTGLRSERKNPNILFPGDVIFIPDKQIKYDSSPTDQRHVFQVNKQRLFLRIRLEREFGDAVRDTKCELRVGSEVKLLTSDASGQIQEEIPSDAHDANLIVKDTIEAAAEAQIQKLPLNVEMKIKIGHMDPSDKPSGQLARLINLGYYRAAEDPVDSHEFQSAIEEFQCDHGLLVDGKCGPKTRAKLEEVHGC